MIARLTILAVALGASAFQHTAPRRATTLRRAGTGDYLEGLSLPPDKQAVLEETVSELKEALTSEPVAPLTVAAVTSPPTVAEWRAQCDESGVVSFYDAGVRLSAPAASPAAEVAAKAAVAAPAEDAERATVIAGAALLAAGAAALGLDLEVATLAATVAAAVSVFEEESSFSQLLASVGRLGKSTLDGVAAFDAETGLSESLKDLASSDAPPKAAKAPPPPPPKEAKGPFAFLKGEPEKPPPPPPASSPFDFFTKEKAPPKPYASAYMRTKMSIKEAPKKAEKTDAPFSFFKSAPKPAPKAAPAPAAKPAFSFFKAAPKEAPAPAPAKKEPAFGLFAAKKPPATMAAPAASKPAFVPPALRKAAEASQAAARQKQAAADARRKQRLDARRK